MDNRGQLPLDKWLMGLFMVFVLMMAYEFFAPIIDTTLPTAFPYANANSLEIFGNTKTNFLVGCLILGFGYLLYIFFGGIPGQEEAPPI